MKNKDQKEDLQFNTNKIFLYLTLVGLTMIFVGLSIAYLYSRNQMGMEPIPVPSLFIANTLILLASSYTINRCKKAYLADDTAAYKRYLLSTILLTLIFIVAQYFAWNQMIEANNTLQSGNGSAYLYAISILHYLHVLGGLPFLLLFYHTARKRMVEPVSVLVYFSDPDKKSKLDLLSFYWHFLDGLWIYLVIFFYLNWLL